MVGVTVVDVVLFTVLVDGARVVVDVLFAVLVDVLQVTVVASLQRIRDVGRCLEFKLNLHAANDTLRKLIRLATIARNSRRAGYLICDSCNVSIRQVKSYHLLLYAHLS